jgi:hypothetical protein
MWSASPPIADIEPASVEVCFAPRGDFKATIVGTRKAPSKSESFYCGTAMLPHPATTNDWERWNRYLLGSALRRYLKSAPEESPGRQETVCSSARAEPHSSIAAAGHGLDARAIQDFDL